MLETVHNRPVSAPSELDPNLSQLTDPVFVREAHQLMRYYARFLRRHWLLLITLPLVGGAVAAAVTQLPARTYEATAKMLASGEPPAATYLPYLRGRSVADEALQAVKFDDLKTGLTRAEFLESAYRAEVVRNTNVLSATVTLPDPETAAVLVNQISAAAIAHSRRTNSTETAAVLRDLLRTRLDEARSSLERATERVVAHREKTGIDALRKDIAAAFPARRQLLDLSVRIDDTRARLRRAQADLASLSRIDALHRTINESTLLAEAARVANKKPIDLVAASGVQVRVEEVNRVYDSVNRDVATARAVLGDLELRRVRLVRTQRLKATERKKLSQLYSAERELARLELERTLRENAFSEAFNRYESARLHVARLGELSMLDLALPPDRPVARGTARNTVLGSLIGLVLAIGVVIWRAH